LKTKTKIWTLKEKQFVIDNYSNMTMEQIAKSLNCKKNQVYYLLQILNIKKAKPKTSNKWSEEQLQLLKDNYRKLSRVKLSKLINQSENNIRNKLIELKLVTNENKKTCKNPRDDQWTLEEENYLIENYNKINVNVMVDHLNKSSINIHRKIKRLNIPKKSFNKIDDEVLKNNFNKCSFAELKKMLPGKSEKQITRRLQKLKLLCRKQTLPEKIMEGILISNNFIFEAEKKINGSKYICDFVLNNIVIEVQGDYWHGNPSKYKKLNKMQEKISEKDKRKDSFLKSKGYFVIYVWENDLYNNVKICEEKIINFIQLHCSN